jgi:hypothetical protein
MAKVITLQQPWAELCVLGLKQFETRGWRTSYRGELYIHASAHFEHSDLELCHVNEFFREAIPSPHTLECGKVIGKVNLSDILDASLVSETLEASGRMGKRELSFGLYSPGRWAWQLTHAVKFSNPIRHRGALSIWEIDDVKIEGLLPIFKAA